MDHHRSGPGPAAPRPASRFVRAVVAVIIGCLMVFTLTAPGFADRGGNRGGDDRGRDSRPSTSATKKKTPTAAHVVHQDDDEELEIELDDESEVEDELEEEEDEHNHGWYVSRVARTVTPGPDHGKIVSAVARGELDPWEILGTATPTPTGSPIAEETPTPTPTDTAEATPTATPEDETTATATPEVTGSPTATATPEVNHGQVVSRVARDVPPGPDHGNIVSGVARGDIAPADLTGTPTATPPADGTATPTGTPTGNADATSTSRDQQSQNIGAAVVKFLADLLSWLS